MSEIVRGVEVFATGIWNGERYTEEDLDDMVHAFKRLDFRPALKLGHDSTPGTPAVGYVHNLYRDGEKLKADVVDLDPEVRDQIKKRRYDRVSAEIFFNLKRAGHIFRRALKAVALLGAEIPGVAGLAPLHTARFAAERASDEPRSEPASEGRNASEVVHDRAQKYLAANPLASYSAAVAAILDADAELRREYAGGGFGREVERVPVSGRTTVDRGEAGAEVHKRVIELMREHNKLNYYDGLLQVLREDPDLARRYRAVLHGGKF